MKYLIAICLIAASPIAASDSSSAQSNSSSMAAGNGFGGMGGTSYGAGGVGTGTGGSSINSQSLHLDQVRQSPAVFMGAPMPTAPCQASIGGFLSFIGGIGLAGSRTLEECEKRESSRIAHSIGETRMAFEIMCMTEYGSKTSSCKEAPRN